MMPEPTTVATSSPVPSASAASRRGQSKFCMSTLLLCSGDALDEIFGAVRLPVKQIAPTTRHKAGISIILKIRLTTPGHSGILRS